MADWLDRQRQDRKAAEMLEALDRVLEIFALMLLPFIACAVFS